MNKIVKYSFQGIAAVVAVMAAGITYIALTLDPNDYKTQLVKAVQESTQRNLRLEGDIKLSFYPNIGVNISNASLSEFKSDKEFSSVKTVRVSLALLPLLSRKLVVNEVALDGLTVNLIRHKDGTINIDDLLSQGDPIPQEKTSAPAAPVTFDIASVTIENTAISYRDDTNGARYDIKEVSFKSGRVANGVPSQIDFSARVQANQPKLDAALHFKTLLTFDLDKNTYRLQEMDLLADGAALDFTQLHIALQSEVIADLTAQIFKVNGLLLNSNMDGPFGKLSAKLSLPEIEVNPDTFKSGSLTLEADVKQPEQQFNIQLTSPLTGNIKSRQFNLNNLTVSMKATGDKLPNKSLSSEMKGAFKLDGVNQNLQVNLAGGLLQSQIKAGIGVKNFAIPAIKFDIELDQLDADLYLPAPSAETPNAHGTAPEQPFDLAGLKSLNLDGSLRIGALKAMSVKVEKLRVDMKANNGTLKVDPFSANLYQGNIASTITLNAAKSPPEFFVLAKLNNIEIGPLLNDALKMDFLNGKGTVAVNVATQGNRVSLLKQNLNGSLSLNLADGAVKGINLAKSVRDFRKGGDKTEAANNAEQTDFSELKANFKITDGVAHNEDLSLKSPFVRVGGKGDINLGNDSLDYLVKATVVRTSEGQGGKDDVGGLTVPVRLSGPYSDIKYKLEFSSMVSDAAKQKVSAAADAAKQKAVEAADVAKQKAQQAIDAQKEQAKAKAEEQLKSKLKGLFK